MILVANKADLESERVVSCRNPFLAVFYLHSHTQVPKQEGEEIAQQLKVSVNLFQII